MLRLSALLLCVAFVHSQFAVHNIPQFPATYHVVGYVDLPYWELQEPFEFWVLDNDTFKASRLDWYQGLDIVISLPSTDSAKRSLKSGDYGTQYKISYTTLTEDNKAARSCFEVDGDSSAPVATDALLPDLTGFEYGGSVVDFGKPCEFVYKKEIVGYKENIYKFYYTENDDGTATPVGYKFLGYDHLFGSHYDRYDIIYSAYSTDDFSTAVFDVNTIMDQSTCAGYPGPGVSKTEHKIWMNPIQDLLHGSRYEDAHSEFADEHGKEYANEYERRDASRKYMNNVRLIHSKNRQGLSYKLKVNFMADMDTEERKAFLGLKHKKDGRVPSGLKVGKNDKKTKTSLPDAWDWRIVGAVTVVKDQAICGSCWSFGTVGTLEGAYFLKYGQLKRLSQQNLIDCSWKEGNDGCDGGEDWRSYEYIQSSYGGLMAEEDYGHYLGQNGKCHYNSSLNLINIDKYYFVTGEDETVTKQALLQHGPLSVGIDASQPSLSFYSHGVYDDPACKNGVDDLDHAVLLVGYGTLDGKDYWLVKNSWSTNWGNLGYVTFAIKDNVCGVMTQPTYVTLA